MYTAAEAEEHGDHAAREAAGGERDCLAEAEARVGCRQRQSGSEAGRGSVVVCMRWVGVFYYYAAALSHDQVRKLEGALEENRQRLEESKEQLKTDENGTGYSSLAE